MIRRIRSNGASVESSRRPMILVRRKTNQKITTARRTRSISSRVDGHAVVEYEDLLRTVVELDVLRPSPGDVRRVDLNLQEQDVRAAPRDVPEVERELSVPARLADRARLDRVDRHALRPAGIEHQHGVLQVLVRVDVEPRAPQEAAA